MRYLRLHMKLQILISLPIISPFNICKDKTNNLKTYRFGFKNFSLYPLLLITFFVYICRISEFSKTERIPDMENYIVSARKYRPSTFESVVGQRALTTTLKNAIATQKLAHAYLFCGPRGVGKTTCARIFAKTINCMTPTADGEACNQKKKV